MTRSMGIEVQTDTQCRAEAAATVRLHTDARFQLVLSWGGWPTDVPLHPLASVHDDVWLQLQRGLLR